MNITDTQKYILACIARACSNTYTIIILMDIKLNFANENT